MRRALRLRQCGCCHGLRRWNPFRRRRRAPAGPGVAAHLPSANATRSVLDHMQDAAQLACAFWFVPWRCTSSALALEGLILECSSAAGATAFVVRTLDPEWRRWCFEHDLLNFHT